MNRILKSVAVGALAMYFLDPQSGRRRRARTRDKLEHARRRLRDAYDVTARDARHRVRGLQAMSQRLLRREDGISDQKLVGRVRAILGRYVSHPHAIEVTTAGGVVTLAGPILEAEAQTLLGVVKHVPGARGVDDRLEVHAQPGNVSSLQGGVPRRGQRFELFQDNWSPSARVLVGAVGLGLLMRGGVLGRLAGAALVMRALSNLDFQTLVGLGEAHGMEVQKTICVNAPVEKVFEFWSHFENFPHFMSRVRDVHLAGNRSHWVVRGPAGVDVEWTSEVVRREANALMEWRSTADSAVKHDGVVRFEPTRDGGTRLSVLLRYVPPGGALGHAVATLFGADPKSEMDADLMRMKSMIETGRAPHDAAQGA
ncbi:MAG TPA: SRPBCC family protein [Burkholderiales bacterium]|nr:SRPBCC family protein [Burkholderiales bacterium]